MPAKLSHYRAKRDFAKTSEPSGDVAPAPGHRFVIQQHAARRMHYDFRLELDGVLLSWSVPKGPSLAPTERRLAVRTEDHPLDYADFEGIIPKGQYGGGTVSVWDRGTWQPEGDARAAVAAGKLTFTLAGAKLHGRWHLVRTKPQGKQETWLLFKGRDDAASDTRDVIVEQPASVLSGRTIDEIAAAPERVWQSNHGGPAPDLNTQLAGLGVELTNLDKVLYPEQGVTKGQIVAYYAVVAERMLPHVAGRPLMLLRCPDGPGKCFFQKHEHGSEKPIVIDDLRGLVGLAQLGALEIHTWGSHVATIDRPDVMVFDLDPDEQLPWDRVAAAAFEVRRVLGERGFTSFVKTTGGKGLHVEVPIAPERGWTEIKALTKSIAEQLEQADPRAFTAKLAKQHRHGRIFVDYLRNGRGATFIAPYSTRARAGAPIATPITWEELAHGARPDQFTLYTLPHRLGEPDPWRDYGVSSPDGHLAADPHRHRSRARTRDGGRHRAQHRRH